MSRDGKTWGQGYGVVVNHTGLAVEIIVGVCKKHLEQHNLVKPLMYEYSPNLRSVYRAVHLSFYLLVVLIHLLNCGPGH